MVAYLDWETHNTFVKTVFMAAGVPEEDAEICTNLITDADKKGIDSHGVNRLKPIYIDRIQAGIQSPTTDWEVMRETPTTAVLDGADGMGQVVSYHAMRMAIDKAKEYGMGMVAVRNSTHYGISGYYTDMAAAEGCIGASGTNARPSIAPTLVLNQSWVRILSHGRCQLMKTFHFLLMQQLQLFKEAILNFGIVKVSRHLKEQ